MNELGTSFLVLNEIGRHLHLAGPGLISAGAGHHLSPRPSAFASATAKSLSVGDLRISRLSRATSASRGVNGDLVPIFLSSRKVIIPKNRGPNNGEDDM